jgi:hypothetical protein
MNRLHLYQRQATVSPPVHWLARTGMQRPKSRTLLTCLCIALLLSVNTHVTHAASLPASAAAIVADHGAMVLGMSRAPGTAPLGWRVYQGKKVPFVIAYPPKWSVDETNAPVGEISFSQITKSASISVTIATRRPAAHLPLNVLRAQFVSFATRACEQGKKVERTGTATSGTVRFATAIAECDSGEEVGEHSHAVMVFYVGVALKSGAQWTFVFRSSKERFQADQRTYFTPMLHTFRP